MVDRNSKEFIKQEYFKNHQVKYQDLGEIEVLEYGEPGTIFGQMQFILYKPFGTLTILGDLGNAVYSWFTKFTDPMSLMKLKNEDVGRFFEKCVSSEEGRKFQVWDEEVAKKERLFVRAHRLYLHCYGLQLALEELEAQYKKTNGLQDLKLQAYQPPLPMTKEQAEAELDLKIRDAMAWFGGDYILMGAAHQMGEIFNTVQQDRPNIWARGYFLAELQTIRPMKFSGIISDMLFSTLDLIVRYSAANGGSIGDGFDKAMALFRYLNHWGKSNKAGYCMEFEPNLSNFEVKSYIE